MSATEFKLVIIYILQNQSLSYIKQANGKSPRSKTEQFGNYVLGLAYLNSEFGETLLWSDRFSLICKKKKKKKSAVVYVSINSDLD